MKPPTPSADSTRRWLLLIGALVLVVGLGVGLGVWLWPRGDGRERAGGEDGEPAAAKLDNQRVASPQQRDLARAPKGSVSGTVRERGGAPLADAQVCAWSFGPELDGLDDGKPRCARTDADGHYRLEGLWLARVRLTASAVGHIPAEWKRKNEDGRFVHDIRLVAGQEATGIDFELDDGGVKIAGVVKDLGGGVIDGAIVQAGNSWFGGHGAVALTDDDGRFELWAKPGSIAVTASAEGYASASRAALAPSERVELFLTPESVLVGRVVHAETGQPVADVTVAVNSAGRFGGFTGSDGVAVRSDADGKFRAGGLSPGAYKPTATSDNLYGVAATKVHLGLGQTSEPVEIRVHPMGYLEGRIVIAGTDEGCRSGRISLTHEDDKRPQRTSCDEQGNVIVRALRPGNYTVEVSCSDMVAEDEYPDLVIGGDSHVGVVWQVREGQAVRGLVVDGEGEPVEGVHVSARQIVDAANARAQTTNAWSSESESDGSFEVAGLLPGNYEISVWANERPTPDKPVEVELAPGADRNDLRIELPAVGSIRGRVVDQHGTPQPGVSVMASPLGKWNSSRTTTDDAGNFLLEHVRTGETRVRAEAAGPFWGGEALRKPGSTDDDIQGELVVITANDTIELELQVEARTGVIRGRVVDEHGTPVDDAFIHADRMSDSATASAGRARNAVRWDWGSEPILTDVDGNFIVDELADGRYVLRAYRKGGGEAIAEGIEVGSSVELTIAPTGMISGTVTIEGSPPPETFSINLRDQAQDLRFGDSFFRTQGVWQLDELPAGTYKVAVDTAAGTAETEVVLEQGASVTGVALTLSPNVTVRGRVVDIDSGAPIPGMQVRISSRGGASSFGSNAGERKQISDAAGRFEVERAPIGRVYVTVMPRNFNDSGDYEWSSELRELPVEPAVQDIGDIALIKKRLKSDESAGDLGFELQQPDPAIEPEDRQLTIGLIRPGGPAAGTELQVGDVIESIDGKSVTGGNSSRYYILSRVLPGTTIELELAGGKTVSLTAGPPIE